MKCFNHKDQEAVATCRHCGKSLCRECAGRYSPCLCDSCFEALRQECPPPRTGALLIPYPVQRLHQRRTCPTVYSRSGSYRNRSSP